MLQVQVREVDFQNISNTDLLQLQGANVWGIAFHQDYITGISLQDLRISEELML